MLIPENTSLTNRPCSSTSITKYFRISSGYAVVKPGAVADPLGDPLAALAALLLLLVLLMRRLLPLPECDLCDFFLAVAGVFGGRDCFDGACSSSCALFREVAFRLLALTSSE